MALPAQKPPQAAANPTASIRRLKKGELLFAEGENSRAMYLIKNGMIRIFKKKGDSAIEIDTVRAGQILGELAFLDGNPRSASGEALTECELMEISGPVFEQVLCNMPDWLKVLLKTVVGRLRTASTRIRQLETASTAFDYSDKDGKRSQHYVYISTGDFLKVATAILLVATRNGDPIGGGFDVKPGLLQRYANQIMGIPMAKVASLTDLLAQVGILSINTEGSSESMTLLDPDFLEKLIFYLNEENLLEPSKRHDISLKGFLVMSLIAKHLHEYPKNEQSGLSKVNIAAIKKAETGAAGKEPFRMDEFPELVKLGYATNVNIVSNDEIYTDITPEAFLLAYRLQRTVISLNALNEQKRKGSK